MGIAATICRRYCGVVVPYIAAKQSPQRSLLRCGQLLQAAGKSGGTQSLCGCGHSLRLRA